MKGIMIEKLAARICNARLWARNLYRLNTNYAAYATVDLFLNTKLDKKTSELQARIDHLELKLNALGAGVNEIEHRLDLNVDAAQAAQGAV